MTDLLELNADQLNRALGATLAHAQALEGRVCIAVVNRAGFAGGRWM